MLVRVTGLTLAFLNYFANFRYSGNWFFSLDLTIQNSIDGVWEPTNNFSASIRELTFVGYFCLGLLSFITSIDEAKIFEFSVLHGKWVLLISFCERLANQHFDIYISLMLVDGSIWSHNAFLFHNQLWWLDSFARSHTWQEIRLRSLRELAGASAQRECCLLGFQGPPKCLTGQHVANFRLLLVSHRTGRRCTDRLVGKDFRMSAVGEKISFLAPARQGCLGQLLNWIGIMDAA